MPEKDPDRVRIWKLSPSVLVAHGSTWHFKPGVTREDFDQEFRKNESKAQRDFAAIPPRTVQSALYDKEIIRSLVNPNRESPIQDDGSFAPWFQGVPSFEYFLHIDMSKSHDSTGYGMCHFDIEENKVIVDLIDTADPTPQWELTFERVYQRILEIRLRGFRLRKVTFDQWQSANMIERLIKAGIDADNYSVDRTTEAYDTLIELLMSRRVDFYYQERFLEEMRTLRLVGGKKYDHPPGGSKDTSDGVAGAVAQCVISRTGAMLTEEEIEKAIVLTDLLNIEESVLKTGATVFQIVEQTPIPRHELVKIRVAQISADDSALFLLWGFNDKSTERLILEDYQIWHDFRNDTSLYHFQVFLQKLIACLKISAISLNADVPLELVTYLSNSGIRTTSPLYARVGGANRGMKNTSRTADVSETSIRATLSQIKRGNLSFPPHDLLLKDLKYLTDTNMMEQIYVAPLVEWTDFAMRELSFGRSAKPMPSGLSVNAPSMHMGAMANSQTSMQNGMISQIGMGGDAAIRRIRERYNKSSPSTPTIKNNSGTELQKSLPRIILGNSRR